MVTATYPSEILMKHANQLQFSDKKMCQCNTTPPTCDCFTNGNKLHVYDAEVTPQNVRNYKSLASKLDKLQNCTLVFNVEETLLKSTSWFPFFMLVAFEGGGLIRAFVLLLLYPLLVLMSQDWSLKVMVFVSFFGVKRKSFRIGRTVLPKFFLEDVGYEGFELVVRFGKRVGVSELPRVMVEGFLKDYLGIESVIGREIKEFNGYYLGLMEEKEVTKQGLDEVLGEENMRRQVIGMAGCAKTIDNNFTNYCKEIYHVDESDKLKWHNLPRNKYPKPLIFHDGRLAFLPTPSASLVMFIWLPFGIILCIIRIILAQFFPYKIKIPLLAFLGTSQKVSRNQSETSSYITNKQGHNTLSKGIVYVCNHKTLLDPIYISSSRRTRVRLTALTYSISKTSQILSPVKTITLTRDRDKDAEIMPKVLSKGSVVVCPEGTTCREPYLLRFSPLFAEISDEIVPVAVDVNVSMFYATTASGIKALDPIVFLLNPYPLYFIKFLEKLPKSHTCGVGGMSRVDVANYVQAQIGKALGYECTGLTRKDKYIMLAGNTGV